MRTIRFNVIVFLVFWSCCVIAQVAFTLRLTNNSPRIATLDYHKITKDFTCSSGMSWSTEIMQSGTTVDLMCDSNQQSYCIRHLDAAGAVSPWIKIECTSGAYHSSVELNLFGR